MPGDSEGQRDEPKPDQRASSRRALAAVFGEVLPETTADERDPGSPSREEPDDSWYLENRPPHHDR
jgi:hypothetical protein